jgi:CRISP-associated protein Cas1
VAALHALAYCERLFYLEEVEEIRVADASVYAGRALHMELLEEEGMTDSRTLEVASEALGLTGKVDALRRRDGQWTPYEHKRGRCATAPDGKPEAWDSDRIQICAYAMLLEEALGEPIVEGRMRYHGSGVTVRVALTPEAREQVRRAIDRARRLRAQATRPPHCANANLCVRCSLAPVCLPEEERLGTDPDWEPVRLFPARQEGQVLHVMGHKSQVGRAGETLVLREQDGAEQTHPVHGILSVVVHGYSQVTTQAIHLCAANGIPIHWLTGSGRYAAGLAADAGPVQRRIRQYRALTDDDTCLRLGRSLTQAKVENQLRFVLRATRGQAERPELVVGSVRVMRDALRSIHRATSIDALRGMEGNAARAYFAALPALLAPGVTEEFMPHGRSRRPPQDRFNALLSFGYSLLYRSVLQAVLAVGLEPALGFFHTPRSAAHPLVLDLMEVFRVAVWDIQLVASINRRQWSAVEDFTTAPSRVWLSDAGRRKAIRLFEARLDEVWRHPVTDYSLSYGRAIELEVRLLEKEWMGQEGLFARMRLR